MAGLPAVGIDVSQFNGDVDFAGFRKQIDFAIIRCGYGGNYERQDDPQYESNVRKCEALGIPYGVYLYSYARSKAMAESEAAHTLRLLRGKKPLYGVWYDVEDSSLPQGDALTDNCVTYCTRLEEAGYYCGIYSSLNWFRTRLNSPRLERFDRWVAQWNSTLDFKGNYGMWQYTDSGILNGRRFDMDRAYRDYPAVISGMEVTDMTREQIAALAREEAEKVVRKNESLYPTIESLPQWAREPVRKVYEELQLEGSGTVNGRLRVDASPTYARALTVIARLLDRQGDEETKETE